MRVVSSLVTLFAVWNASAAPVPTDPKADRQKLEALWAELQSSDAVVRTKATFALIDHPKAVEFLAGKLPPVKASADQLKAWLTDLNSDDEKVWKAAFEELRYFDPRLELTADEQIGLLSTDNARFRLASVWAGELIELPPNTSKMRLEFLPNGAGGRYMNFSVNYGGPMGGGGRGWGLGQGVVDEIATPTWKRAGVAAVVLHRIDTDTSRTALKRLATGHEDALPTRTAAGLLQAKVEPRMPEKRFEAVWADLLTGDDSAVARGVLALTGDPKAAGRLKAKLPAIKANREQVSKWLKALDSEDDKDWKPAFEQLLYFRPLLALNWQEQCDAVTTDHGRSALYHLWSNTPGVPDGVQIFQDAQLDPREDGLMLRYAIGRTTLTTWVTPGDLGTLTPAHWQRARLAILALERAGTADAKAVLAQLADGHPDILPTKEAKAALGRLKK